MTTMKHLLAVAICGATLLATAAQAKTPEKPRELRVYNWADYMLPAVPKEFQDKSGIKLTWDVFDTNEALEAKLLTGNSGYDLVVPTNTFLDTRSRPACSRSSTRASYRTGSTSTPACCS